MTESNATRTINDFINEDWGEICLLIKNHLKEKGYGEVATSKDVEGNMTVSAIALDPDDELNVPVRFRIDWDYTGL